MFDLSSNRMVGRLWQAALSVTAPNLRYSQVLGLWILILLLAGVSAHFFAGPADAQGFQTYSISSSAAAGEGGNASLTISLGQNAPTGGLEFSVTPAYASGTGKAADTDVANLPATVTVDENANSATLSIALAHDQAVEPDETFTVAIATTTTGWSAASSGADTATVTIQDRTTYPPDLQATAGDGELRLTWLAPPGTVTGYDVQFKGRDAVDQPATTPGDPSTGWADAGHSGITTSQTISGLKNDFRYHLRVRAVDAQGSGPWATTGGAPTALRYYGTPKMQFSIANCSINEGYSAEILVTLNYRLTVDTTVRLRIDADHPLNTATETDDYTLSTRTLKIQAFERVASFRVFPRQDGKTEGNETIILKLEPVNGAPYTLGEVNTVRVGIYDLSRDPSLSILAVRPMRTIRTYDDLIAPYEASEDVGTWPVTLLLDQVAPPGGTTVALSIGSESTATEGPSGDFTLSTRSLLIPEGKEYGKVVLRIIDDDVAEGNETIVLQATSTNPQLTAPDRSITILDNDSPAPSQQQQQATPNRAPTVSAALGDVTIVNESGTREASLSGVFADADNDGLTFTAASSDETKATVSVASDQASLTVNAQARGTTNITVTADDGNGGTVSDTFTATVKAAPVLAAALADVTGLAAGATQEVSLSGAFSDADGDGLTVTAASSNDAVATVSVSSDYSALTVAGVAEGTATITVTAQDSDANRVSDAFEVSVTAPQPQINQSPTVSGALGDVTIVNEHGTRKASLSGVFDDTDGDALTITAASSADAVATVSVSADQSALTVSAAARGTATVTVTADDGNGGTVSDTFTVTVKAAPVVSSSLADATGLEVDGTHEVSLSGVFSDADGDSLTITVASSDDAKATVTVASDQSKLTLAGVAVGTATIAVTAQDSDGNRVSDAFDVSVAAPQPQEQQPPAEPPPEEQQQEQVEPPGPVVNLQLSATADSLTVSWQAPESGDAPNRYIAHTKPEGGGKGATKRPKAKKASVTFRDLEAGKTYKVWVRAQNEAGKGERVRATITLPEAAPPQ